MLCCLQLKQLRDLHSTTQDDGHYHGEEFGGVSVKFYSAHRSTIKRIVIHRVRIINSIWYGHVSVSRVVSLQHIVDNYRPPQPLNERLVRASFKHDWNIGRKTEIEEVCQTPQRLIGWLIPWSCLSLIGCSVRAQNFAPDSGSCKFGLKVRHSKLARSMKLDV